MYVKICGLRTADDVTAAVEAGADAVGFVFSESPRRVTAEIARRLAAKVPPRVQTVGVFSGIPADEAGRVAAEAGLNAIQLHGHYPRSAFRQLAGLPFQLIRAISLDTDTDSAERIREIRVGTYGEDLLLLDSPVAGSGTRWDLSKLGVTNITGNWLLAGGLNAANVSDAIATADPWGVDVSSGVESSRGVKDPQLIRDFVSAVRHCGDNGYQPREA